MRNKTVIKEGNSLTKRRDFMQIRINLPATRPLTSSIPIRSSLIVVNSRYITEQIRKNSHSLHLFPLFSSDRVNYTTQPTNIIPRIRESLAWETTSFLPNYFRISASYDRYPSVSLCSHPCGWSWTTRVLVSIPDYLSPGYHIQEMGKP